MRTPREDEKEGVVIEELPNGEFRVEGSDGKVIRCYIAGKMKMNKVRVYIQDKVRYVDAGNIGRITWRY